MAKIELTDRERIHVNDLVAELSQEEFDTVKFIVAGHQNKEIARMHFAAVRTVEARRSRAMAKLQIRTLPELVRFWLAYQGEFQLSGVIEAERQATSDHAVSSPSTQI